MLEYDLTVPASLATARLPMAVNGSDAREIVALIHDTPFSLSLRRHDVVSSFFEPSCRSIADIRELGRLVTHRHIARSDGHPRLVLSGRN